MSTYTLHEAGGRGFTSDRAERYALFFGVSPAWLLYGREAAEEAGRPDTVPLVGYLGAGSQAFFFAKAHAAKNVPAPVLATETTRAIEVRSEDGLGAPFERWIAYYDEQDQGEVDRRHIGQLCIVRLPDGRTLVRKVQASRSPGTYHLTSGLAEPLLDQEIAWAARITGMAPR